MNAIIHRGKGVSVGDKVKVSTYNIVSKSSGKDTRYYHIRSAEKTMPKVYDNQNLPAYLFLGGTILSFIVLWLLVKQLPDLFVRTRIWLRSLRSYSVSIENSKYLPASGPVVMVTNATTVEDLGDIHACCDRQVLTLPKVDGPLPTKVMEATAALKRDELVLVNVNYPDLSAFLTQLQQAIPDVQALPITLRRDNKVHVVLHETVPVITPVEELQRLVKA